MSKDIWKIKVRYLISNHAEFHNTKGSKIGSNVLIGQEDKHGNS